ncbi:tyrosine-type recombinase/integrase [Desulforhopalus singaporensis]|uniref:Site-specific recombinase XerD n=1 Tax=Desulforhopalus singaporensis TaxID=91360 RepID=A0A1H0R0A1_9BACT|nr:site-specific integrase [Desulforhopalus singaporensis]SDP22820.1 Site-specific recombinase XerD [Desulforhopalus singaporensis]
MATVNIVKRNREKGMRYQVYFKDPSTGKKKYYKTFQRQKDAQQAANDLRALLDSGKLPDKSRNKVHMMTFKEVADILEIEWKEKFQTGELAEKTISTYTDGLRPVKVEFGKILLNEIKEEHIKSYRAKVASELSNVSSNKRLFAIKQVFKKGIELNVVMDDPAIGINKLSEKEHERNRFLLPNELFALVDAAKKTKAKHYLPALIWLGAEHGASKQEVLSLKWSKVDFDFENDGKIRLFRTKNMMERTDFLMPNTKDALLHWKKHQEQMRKRKRISAGDSDFVFSHLNGSPIKCFNRAWWSALKIAGIENFHYHDLRHTFCSNLILSGVGIKEVKEMIGHSDIAMTDRYSHLSMDHKLRKQNQLSDYYAAHASTCTEYLVG